MTKDKKKKLVYLGLNIFAVFLALFIIIFTPILCEEIWQSNDALINENAAELSLVVLLPALTSALCFIIADWKFKHRTIEDAKKKVDDLLNQNFIDIEQYIKFNDALNKHADAKEDARIRSNLQKEEMKIKREKEVKAKLKKWNDEIAKVTKEEDQNEKKEQ